MNPITEHLRRSLVKPSRGDRRKPPGLRLEALEAREVPATFAFDFDTATTTAAPGYTHVPLVAYNPSLGYGWQSVSGMQAVNRSTGDPLTSDLHLGTDSTFLARRNGQEEKAQEIFRQAFAHEREDVGPVRDRVGARGSVVRGPDANPRDAGRPVAGRSPYPPVVRAALHQNPRGG